VFKIFFLNKDDSQNVTHLNFQISDFKLVEAEVYSENIDNQSPLIYKDTLTNSKMTHKLVFDGD
jgi:hypothetical protein